MNIMGYATVITFFVVPVVFVVSSLPLTTIAEDVSFALPFLFAFESVLGAYGFPRPQPTALHFHSLFDSTLKTMFVSHGERLPQSCISSRDKTLTRRRQGTPVVNFWGWLAFIGLLIIFLAFQSYFNVAGNAPTWEFSSHDGWKSAWVPLVCYIFCGFVSIFFAVVLPRLLGANSLYARLDIVAFAATPVLSIFSTFTIQSYLYGSKVSPLVSF